jgi:phage-related protein
MISPPVTTDIESLVYCWRRDLRAALTTIKTYGESADQLVAHVARAGVTEVQAVRRDHVADWPEGTRTSPGRDGDWGDILPPG